MGCRAFLRSAGRTLAIVAAVALLGCGTAAAPDEALDGPVGPNTCAPSAPAVAQCDGLGCTIPAGCFVQGIAPSDPCRRNEPAYQRTVTITRAFAMSRTEQFRGNAPWTGPGPEPPCKDQCPALADKWTTAAAACNALSRARGLPECYVCAQRLLDDAPAPVLVCDGGGRETFLACRGYRLPTAAEWEYAARAGARTPLPNGTPTVCQGGPDPLADAIAWYKHNAEGTLHAVGLKQPNAWGLYDMLGNAAEWVEDSGYVTARAEALMAQLIAAKTGAEKQQLGAEFGAEIRRVMTTSVIDPAALPQTNTLLSWDSRRAVGGNINDEVSGLRPGLSGSHMMQGPATFRCVRTLAP